MEVRYMIKSAAYETAGQHHCSRVPDARGGRGSRAGIPGETHTGGANRLDLGIESGAMGVERGG